MKCWRFVTQVLTKFYKLFPPDQQFQAWCDYFLSDRFYLVIICNQSKENQRQVCVIFIMLRAGVVWKSCLMKGMNYLQILVHYLHLNLDVLQSSADQLRYMTHIPKTDVCAKQSKNGTDVPLKWRHCSFIMLGITCPMTQHHIAELIFHLPKWFLKII
jgi:hypothetical protein